MMSSTALQMEKCVTTMLTNNCRVLCRDVPVSNVMAFGCVVDFAVGKSGLVHVSELDTSRTADASAKWKVGDKMDVKVLEYEKASGRCKLSRSACAPPCKAAYALHGKFYLFLFLFSYLKDCFLLTDKQKICKPANRRQW